MFTERPKEDTANAHTEQASLSERIAAVVLRPSLFWLAFLLLNLLLFLPAYLLNQVDSSLLPQLAGGWSSQARQLLTWRHNLDPFRLSAEFTLLLGAWLLLSRLRKSRLRVPFLALLAFVYLLALLYAIYENLSLSLYQEDPLFYAQAQLILEGLPFVLRHLSVAPAWIAAGALAILLALGGIFALLRLVTAEGSTAALGVLSKTVLTALVFFILASFLFNGRALASPKSVVSCLTCKIGRNIDGSIASAARVHNMQQIPLDQVYDYGDYALLARPDIYLIFIESYGGMLYRRQLREPYLELLEEVEQELAGEGWHASTILSESPSWGGGSWMAYTSALFGLRLDTHPAYLALMQRFADGSYPHLGNTLQEMGYEHARVTSIAVELDEEKWQQYRTFYGTDRWLRHRDLAYDGRHYGWGPAPPDQFVLNAANQELQKSGRPLFLFLITQNSHYPWQELPPLAAEWQTLNDGSEPNPKPQLTTPKVKVKPDDYMASIRYELRFLTRFIREEADEDAIFILVGDHQPGYITRPEDGLETPLHILSKDETLVSSFYEYGFVPGLSLENPEAGMKHEGLYSLLMRALLQRYGRGDRLPPPYLPHGAADINVSD